ncbi:MAG TPA: aromatic acid exporter family protein [Bacillota bacterium]|nr:aromatic acid exporter family protein [Bacillota bacterium]
MKITERIFHFLYRTGMVWKSGLATAISWEICVRLGFVRPTMAPIAAILCLQVTVSDSIKRAYQRTLGTIIGVIITAIAIHKLGVNVWSVGLVVTLSILIGRWIKISDQIIPQIGTTAILVFVLQSQNHHYPLDRIEETLIGCITAILINMLLFPPNYSHDAIRSIQSYTEQLAECFIKTAEWIKQGCEPNEGEALRKNTQSLLEQLHQTMDNYELAITSLKFNPFASKSRNQLNQYNKELLHLRQGYAHISGMLRTLNEWAACSKLTERERDQWYHHMLNVSSFVKAWIQTKENLTNPITLPPELERQRFPFALHNDAIQMVEDFKSSRE